MRDRGIKTLALTATLAATVCPAAAAKGKRQIVGDPYAARPNVIQVILDDATTGMLGPETTPHIWRWMAGRGTRFTEAIATSPLCCPARATLKTGQYGHNNGVLRIEPGYEELRQPGNVLEVWMHRAGYFTAHVGKVMAGLPRTLDVGEIPPGWDRWVATRSHHYLQPKFNLDGNVHKFRKPQHHITRIINRRSAGILRGALRDGRQPVFLSVAQLAPHRSVRTEEGERCSSHARPWARLNVEFELTAPPRGPAYDEADVSDKPPMIQERERISPAAAREITLSWHCAVASLAAVDRGFRQLVRILRRKGELARTALIVLSDNGVSYGQHRIALTKHFPYEENVRVPLMIRLPREQRGAAGLLSDARVALIDIAPTILELAAAEPCRPLANCRTLDGRSLVKATRGEPEDWHDDRVLGVELARGDWHSRIWPCRYSGVRTPRGTYFEHEQLPDRSGACAPGHFVEVYDAAADPFQLENLAASVPGIYAEGTPGKLERDLRAVNERISTCTGIEGRDPAPPPGRSYCD